jgi:hypothetical protein
MTKEEALRLALEALEKISMGGDPRWADEAITALRLAIDVENMTSVSTYKEALETKDEPVAIVISESGSNVTHSWWHEPALPIGTKLYTSPQRTWVGLIVDEIAELVCNLEDPENRIELGKKIEAKLKEKNT